MTGADISQTDSDEIASALPGEDAKDSDVDKEDDDFQDHGDRSLLGSESLNISPAQLVSWLAFSDSTCVESAFPSKVSVKAILGEENKDTPVVSSSRDFIQIAQIAVDQAVFSSFSRQFSTESTFRGKPGESMKVLNIYNRVVDRAIQNLFPQGRQLPLKSLTYQDLAEPALRTNSDNSSQPRFLRLQSPYTCIRRMDSKMDILPSALTFWEEFGLAPACGHKDVLATCLVPENQHFLEEPIKTFLRMTRDAYQACSLGNHTIMDDENGESDAAFRAGGYKGFGDRLAQIPPLDGTLVVYLVNQDSSSATPYDLCAGILSILEGYRNGLQSRDLAEPPDLAVQIISQSLIFSPHELVVPPISEFKKISFEVYNRCGPPAHLANGRLPYMTAPSVILSTSIPQKIDFQLTVDATAPALSDDNRIHLAYTWKPASQWLTASWTDNLGIMQWNAAYWIGRDSDKPWQPFIDIFREIIETTRDMLRPPSRMWEIFVGKLGRMFTDELSCRFADTGLIAITNDCSLAWKLALSEMETSSFTFAFVTVEAEPSLQFSLPSKANVKAIAGFSILETPAPTPDGSGHSPDAQTSAPTPGPTGFDQEADARLLDVRDETWVLLPSANLGDPNLPSKFCRAQSRAYLLKQAGAGEEDGLLPLAVNAVHGGDTEEWLLEVLGMYRDLATLARVRNITDSVIGILPLHVAAASKAYAALNNTMRYAN